MDVILLGHSMAGFWRQRGARGFRHRGLGVVKLDSPFPGMHPEVISARLGSLFGS
ncbi:unnamed protein product, partial [Tuber aestivum]